MAKPDKSDPFANLPKSNLARRFAEAVAETAPPAVPSVDVGPPSRVKRAKAALAKGEAKAKPKAPSDAKFDKKVYQRDLMRKRRAAAREKAGK